MYYLLLVLQLFNLYVDEVVITMQINVISNDSKIFQCVKSIMRISFLFDGLDSIM